VAERFEIKYHDRFKAEAVEQKIIAAEKLNFQVHAIDFRDEIPTGTQISIARCKMPCVQDCDSLRHRHAIIAPYFSDV
jgi:hypothetical protein